MTNSIVSKDALVGMWKLIEMKSIDKEETIIYPFGKDPVSYIIYTKEGYVSFSIMMSNRLNLGLSIQNLMDLGYGIKSKTSILQVSIFKYIKAIIRYFQSVQKFVSYTGKYEVKDNKVIHNIEIHVVPDLIGADLERIVEISGDTLFLSSSYPEYTVYSTWERVS
ncbi:lipocalin-like domain-containing protein [Roseofilum reptotaenium CS-1145]|uniref:Lipocalin-like domain-containing protein n=1 Tax=Roseofilum reptotaenium AO1-A TaxID=1925591 RepID=A0A1L9QNY9_9CYAN|nr:lipocalin-like domain-containing protein [Roseofilum reptotaenium]MDB9517404.1 lipocalin-like domain-containing protein [Roseofilum reptotaenium CS-1145]OJJ24390.1 hypothetical protein BI308_17040 [Roseofilum reptotaenium AO1-A]